MNSDAAVSLLPPLSDEFEGVALGDHRRNLRCRAIVDAAAAQPAKSLAQQAKDAAALEGTYRFLSNPSVNADAILAPHLSCTAQRCGQSEVVLALHDSTEFEYDKDSLIHDEIGWLTRSKRGFLAHVALAVSADGERRPLGVLGLRTYFRETFEPGVKKKREQVPDQLHGEANRWADLAFEVSVRVGEQTKLIHVMDREADAYPLLSRLMEAGERFIIRVKHDRSVVDETDDSGKSKLSAVLERAHGVLEREVAVSKRKPHVSPAAKKRHPARSQRLARLHFCSSTVTFLPPQRSKAAPVTLQVVRVWEPEPPEGQAPIEWRLETTEPADTPELVAQIVDWYRARWVIEEYFKALKTGCAFQRRHVESRQALLNTLAIFASVAWRLLLIRTLSRHSPDEPGSRAFTPAQIQILKFVNKKHNHRVKLSRPPKVGQLAAILAKMGGHFSNTTPAGWQTLGAGYDKLLIAELGWFAHADFQHM
jgi:hypothetical protein